MKRALPWLFAALAVIVAYFLIKSGGARTGPVVQKSKLSGTLDSISGLTKAVSGFVGTIEGAFGKAPPPANNVIGITAPAAERPFVPPPANEYQIMPFFGDGSGGLAGDIQTSGD